eukprot:9481206-Pyramimonas_sp.AAC.1
MRETSDPDALPDDMRERETELRGSLTDFLYCMGPPSVHRRELGPRFRLTGPSAGPVPIPSDISFSRHLRTPLLCRVPHAIPRRSPGAPIP